MSQWQLHTKRISFSPSHWKNPWSEPMVALRIASRGSGSDARPCRWSRVDAPSKGEVSLNSKSLQTFLPFKPSCPSNLLFLAFKPSLQTCIVSFWGVQTPLNYVGRLSRNIVCLLVIADTLVGYFLSMFWCPDITTGHNFSWQSAPYSTSWTKYAPCAVMNAQSWLRGKGHVNLSLSLIKGRTPPVWFYEMVKKHGNAAGQLWARSLLRMFAVCSEQLPDALYFGLRLLSYSIWHDAKFKLVLQLDKFYVWAKGSAVS